MSRKCILLAGLIFFAACNDVSKPTVQNPQTIQQNPQTVQPTQPTPPAVSTNPTVPSVPSVPERPANERPMVQFTAYLVQKEGFEVQIGTGMPPGVFNAEDLIQFKIVDPKATIIAVKFADEIRKSVGLPQFSMLAQDGRRIISDGLYAIAIKSDDDTLDKTIKDALLEFQNR